MVLARLLGDVPAARFLEEHYYRMPYVSAGGARPFADLADEATACEIVVRPDADTLVARDGAVWDGGRPKSVDEARRLHGEGWTLLVRHSERHDARIRELAAGFRSDLGAPVNVHLYCTPGGRHGFGWHYDSEEVFILQTRGRKSYELRKNSVNPLPLAETTPRDMGFERETSPVGLRCTLESGDWLYVPSGWWHRARAEEAGASAVSLAVGLMPATGMDALDRARRRLLRSPLWRFRLPSAGDAAAAAGTGRQALRAAYRTWLAQLADDVAREMRDESLVDELLDERPEEP